MGISVHPPESALCLVSLNCMARENWSLWHCIIPGPGASQGWAAWWRGVHCSVEHRLTESITTTKAGGGLAVPGPLLQGVTQGGSAELECGVVFLPVALTTLYTAVCSAAPTLAMEPNRGGASPRETPRGRMQLDPSYIPEMCVCAQEAREACSKARV